MNQMKFIWLNWARCYRWVLRLNSVISVATPVQACYIKSPTTRPSVQQTVLANNKRKHQESKLLALCEENPPVTSGFPSQMANDAESIPITWRHHEDHVPWPGRWGLVQRSPHFSAVRYFHCWGWWGTCNSDFWEGCETLRTLERRSHRRNGRGRYDNLKAITSLKWRCRHFDDIHYDDVIMTTLASQITSFTIVYSIVYSGVDQRKHKSSASLAFVRGIHRDRWIPRTKGQ